LSGKGGGLTGLLRRFAPRNDFLLAILAMAMLLGVPDAHAIKVCKKTVGGIMDQMYPVGVTYIQFADETGTFNANEEPGNLFAGTTWAEMFGGDGVFFKTTGHDGAMARIDGLQGDAIRNITGKFHDLGEGPPWASGAFSVDSYRSNPYTPNDPDSTNTPVYSLDASRVVPTDTYNHPRNRLIKVWKRTN
jgi:hypothetical protein